MTTKHKVHETFLQEIGLNIAGNVILCHTCLRVIKTKKVPSINITNGLQLENVPEELKLTQLEQQLIAKSLLFLKVKKLPTTRMKANHDIIINVPVESQDVSKTLSKLPIFCIEQLFLKKIILLIKDI